MAKLVVRVPIRADIHRDEVIDKIARDAADRLSSTPVEDFKFETRMLSDLQPDVDTLVYSGEGTPHDE